MMEKMDIEVKHNLPKASATGLPCLLHPAKGINSNSEYGTHRESLQVAVAPPQPLPSSPPIAKGAAVHRRLRTCHFDRAACAPPYSHFRLLLLRICVPFIIALK